MLSTKTLIAKHPLMSLIPEEVLSTLQNLGQITINPFHNNQLIHIAGEPCRKLEILLLGGELVVERIDENGDLLTIVSFKQQELIGGNTLFSKKPNYLMTITARTDGTLIAINKSTLLELLSTYPMFLEAYLENISDRASTLGSKLRDQSNKSLRDKLLVYLKAQSSKQGSSTIKLPTSKKNT